MVEIWMMVERRLLRYVFAVACLVVLAAGVACGDSDGDPEASPTATVAGSTPAATQQAQTPPAADGVTPPPASSGDAADAEAAIRRFFQLTSERDVDGLYDAYAEAWRDQCSTERVEQTFAMLDESGVDEFEVRAVTDIAVTGDAATASVDIVARDAAGAVVREYTYPIKLKREDGRWKVDEVCQQEQG
jgi:hypothetical protein